jgi:hypothetical protein
MTSEGLKEMFEGDYADMCAGKFSASVDGWPGRTARVPDQGERTPIGASGNFKICYLFESNKSIIISCIELVNGLNRVSCQD